MAGIYGVFVDFIWIFVVHFQDNIPHSKYQAPALLGINEYNLKYLDYML